MVADFVTQKKFPRQDSRPLHGRQVNFRKISTPLLDGLESSSNLIRANSRRGGWRISGGHINN
jgi:hypothetical protein